MRINFIILLIAISTQSFAQNLRKDGYSEQNNKDIIDNSWMPVIGVFLETTEDLSDKFDPAEGYSYIAASYVKWLQSSGAQVVPIPYNIKTVDELNFLLDKVNGILLPGGDASLWANETTKEQFSNMTKVGQMIYEKAEQYNKNGDVFPIWATCMSYEMIMLIVTQNPKLLDNFDSDNHPLNVTIFKNVTSPLYNSIPKELHQNIEYGETFYFNHIYGLKPEHFYDNKALTDVFDLTSTGYYKNQTFVATMEDIFQMAHILSQYHPEKNAFEYLDSCNANKGGYAVEIASQTATYFVNLARQSKHRFDSFDQQSQYLIQNYQPINSINWKAAGYVAVYVLQVNTNGNLPEESKKIYQ